MKVLEASASKPMAGGASFTLGNRLARVAWGLCWLILARWTPPPLHRWRAAILRAWGARIAPGARIHASVRIWLPRNLQVGRDSLIGPGALLYNQGRITIGDRVVISQRAHICASTHSVSDPHFQLVLRPIQIASDCWVAAEAFVGPGVEMGAGSVLAARGALFENAEPWGIYRGNPAVKIKQRQLRAPRI